MISLIIGEKGSGKTKQMIELINSAVKTTKGNIVCVEKGMKLTYDLDHKCRLIDLDEYCIDSPEKLFGFIAGILAGNYDIVEVYVDGILKILGHDNELLGNLLAQFDKLTGEAIKMVVTVSDNVANLPQSVLKYTQLTATL